ncbi:amidohydrolase family protein [Falsiroseomonas sp.]|uniref:metal-dependent hydrolase family protein n=1 Tax=Falsiroseomonas sp. TaxID=2870721 RepID=UPI0034A32A3B
MKVLLRGGAVLDVEAGALNRQDVLIKGARIVAIGTGLAAPDARVVELGGRTVMPGLIDSHAHVCADGMVAYPSLFPSLVTARAAQLLRDSLLRGFTTIRDMGGADAGLRRAVEEGLFPGPRLFVSGRPLSQTGGHGDMRNPADACPACALRAEANMMVVADGVDGVRRAAREEIRRGVDQIKIMASGGISSPSDPVDYDQYSDEEITAAVDEARRAGKYVAAHAYMSSAIARAVSLGVRTIEHGNFLDEATARVMAERGAILVPTLVVYRRVVRHAAEIGISAFHLAKAEEVLATGTRSLEIAHRAGVKMALGTDLFRAPKQYQAEELQIRAEALPVAEVLRSATIIGAEVVRKPHELGRVAEGYLADLLVVDGDPLSDLGLLQDQGAHLSMIFKGGEVVKDTLA